MSVALAGVLPLWLCADAGTCAPGDLLDRVRRVLAGVPACVWLRPQPGASARLVRDLAAGMLRAARDGGGALVVGDRLDVALSVGADGVHLPSLAIPPAEARRLIEARRARAFVSAAVHDEASVRAAGAAADVLVLSPFGAVPGKGPALAIGGFARMVALCPGRAFVALGGVGNEREAADAARAGASAIAVRRALLDAPDPLESCAALHTAFVFARARAGRDDAVPAPGDNRAPAPAARLTLHPPA